MAAYYDGSTGRRLSTEEVCREAAEKLGQMHIRSFRDDPDVSCAMPLHGQEQPPPYSGYGAGYGGAVDSPAQFLVPPPPPPSPGSALKGGSRRQDGPVPSAPPPPPLPPSCAQPQLENPCSYYGFPPHPPTANVGASPAGYLQPPVDPALSQAGSVGPSPVHIPSYPWPAAAPYNTAEVPLMTPHPLPHYPPPTQIPANTTAVMVQPPPPPPPPPVPASSNQNNVQNVNNQNTNTNANSVNVNMESTTIVGNVKERLYPNYLSFSLILFFICWVLNPSVYFCIIPALICSCISCSTSSYGTSKFTGKWAFCCNLTALIFGLISFLVAILPMIIIFSLAAAGIAGLKALEAWMNGGVEDEEFDNYDTDVSHDGL